MSSVYAGELNARAPPLCSFSSFLSLLPACVFTVSDAPDFAQAGGMVELFREGDRMRIAVNIDAIERARIRLSSRVLALARIVREAPERKPGVDKR